MVAGTHHTAVHILPVLCRLGTADPNKGVLRRLWLVPGASCPTCAIKTSSSHHIDSAITRTQALKQRQSGLQAGETLHARGLCGWFGGLVLGVPLCPFLLYCCRSPHPDCSYFLLNFGWLPDELLLQAYFGLMVTFVRHRNCWLSRHLCDGST